MEQLSSIKELFLPDISSNEINWDPVIILERLPDQVRRYGMAIVKCIDGKWDVKISQYPTDYKSTGDKRLPEITKTNAGYAHTYT